MLNINKFFGKQLYIKVSTRCKHMALCNFVTEYWSHHSLSFLTDILLADLGKKYWREQLNSIKETIWIWRNCYITGICFFEKPNIVQEECQWCRNLWSGDLIASVNDVNETPASFCITGIIFSKCGGKQSGNLKINWSKNICDGWWARGWWGSAAVYTECHFTHTHVLIGQRASIW